MFRGKGISEKKASNLSAQLSRLLPQDESIKGIFKAYKKNTLVDYIIITESRVLCAMLRIVGEGYKFVHEIHASDINTGNEIKSPKLGRAEIRLTDGEGKLNAYVQVRKTEAEEILRMMNEVKGTPESLESMYGKEGSESSKLIEEFKGLLALAIEDIKKAYEAWSKDKWRVITVGDVNRATLKEIKSSCRKNEHPEFIIGGKGASGALVAFSDRCIIIKKGVMTSLVAGTLGGGRVSTFYYRDITGIEYNSGIFLGGLEILTPSYSGATTSGSHKTNTKPDIMQLPNTLPLDRMYYKKVRPKIEWLKQRVEESKNTQSSIDAGKSDDVVSQLEKLSTLNKSGVLSDDEFSKAKDTLLNKL